VSCFSLGIISNLARLIDRDALQNFPGERDKRATPPEKEYECPEGEGNGNFADPATCRRFYQVRRKITIIGNYPVIILFIKLCDKVTLNSEKLVTNKEKVLIL
jgi:hypothetical protein